MSQAITTGDGGPRALAARLVTTLGRRPFALTAAQLTGVSAGAPVPGQPPGPLAHVVAGRYAGLLADHLVEGAASDEAIGAYFRIWLCARQAFLRSLDTNEPRVAPDPDLPVWENEGGAVLASGPAGRDGQDGGRHAASD